MPNPTQKPRGKTPPKAPPKTPPAAESADLLASLLRRLQEEVGASRRTLEGPAREAAAQHARIAGLLRTRGPEAPRQAAIPAPAAKPVWSQAPLLGAGPDPRPEDDEEEDEKKEKKKPGYQRGKTAKTAS
ncbi:MAG: hypothetical protein R3325_04070 [Thermoanaerobaculia bacterium]|nr:hypothetical protein [Thermoanaerobaculia bacterium]